MEIVDSPSGNRHETTDVDTPVENEEVSLDSCCRVDNNSLSRLQSLEGGALDRRLVTEQRTETRLDETRGETENEQTEDERDVTVAAGNDGRNGRDNEQDVGESTDGDSDTNGLESTPLGVGDDTTENGDQVGEESECLTGGRGGDRTHSESTG